MGKIESEGKKTRLDEKTTGEKGRDISSGERRESGLDRYISYTEIIGV